MAKQTTPAPPSARIQSRLLEEEAWCDVEACTSGNLD
jgi:hypothetical protein